jgi:hypothetical protein
MRSTVASACFFSLLVACVGDSPTASPSTDGGTDSPAADTGGGTCDKPKTSCTKGPQTVCTDTASDDQNCGQCNTVCPAGASCKSSACACTDATKTFCALNSSGTCTDVKTDSKNCGTCGNTCFTDHCVNGECDRVAFVTSSKHFTNFTSQNNPFPDADAICTTAATAGKLPGKYMAWISADGNWPAGRFTTKSATPYVRTDKTVIANNWGDLTDGSLNAPINRDENGTALGSSERVMTDTNTDGTLTSGAEHCNNWTDVTGTGGYTVGQGDPGAINASWTGTSATGTCTSQYHLYCFQQ